MHVLCDCLDELADKLEHLVAMHEVEVSHLVVEKFGQVMGLNYIGMLRDASRHIKELEAEHPINIALFKKDKDPGSNQPDWEGHNSNTGYSATIWVNIADNKEKSEYLSLRVMTKADRDKRMAELKASL